MTYAALKIPYIPTEQDVSVTPKEKMKLSGKLKSGLKKAGKAVKNTILHPGESMKTLGKYLQNNEDKILNKFSGIAVAQLLANGKVTNKQALDYLFLGAAPALGVTASALGYSGVQQMKTALTNGTINVGQFVNGFTKALKAGIDFKNKQANIESYQGYKILEIDITYSHQENYQSETPDRRVEQGITYSEVLHNLPETFNLNCGIQDGRRYSVTEFKDLLRGLRRDKTPFDIIIDGETTENVVLQNFTPVREGATNGLEYALELKKIKVGSTEITPIEIQALPTQESATTTTGSGGGSSKTSSGSVVSPNLNSNPYFKSVMSTPKHRSLLRQLQLTVGG